MHVVGCTVYYLDAKKRNILDIADIGLRLPLHYTASHHSNPAATKLLVRHHRPALLVKDKYSDIPLNRAESNKSPTVVSLLRELTTARRATIALRTALLLCIKLG